MSEAPLGSETNSIDLTLDDITEIQEYSLLTDVIRDVVGKMDIVFARMKMKSDRVISDRSSFQSPRIKSTPKRKRDPIKEINEKVRFAQLVRSDTEPLIFDSSPPEPIITGGLLDAYLKQNPKRS